ncbi:MAG: general secretion pathway protein GspK [Candidatus Rokuibacteriota bacterium]
MTPGARRQDERGFALLAVLLVVALLGMVGAEFAYSMRLEASAARAWRDGIAATHLAEAAVEQAIREIVADAQFVGVDEAGVMTFYTRERTARPRLSREKVPLGMGHFTYRITDEEARLNLNTTPPERLDRLLQQLGLDKSERDVIVNSLLDWRDPNEEHRLSGAESDDYYLKLPVPYRSRNANLESVSELLQIRGVTPTLFRGSDGKPGLADFVSVKTRGQVNINTASEPVLRAHGLSDAEVSLILQTRSDEPFFTPPSQFGGRGFVVNTQTFRIEAEGLVGDRVQARITAVVQRRADPAATGGAGVAYLEWWAGR